MLKSSHDLARDMSGEGLSWAGCAHWHCAQTCLEQSETYEKAPTLGTRELEAVTRPNSTIGFLTVLCM